MQPLRELSLQQDLQSIVFYLSVTFVGLFLTHRALETQRWRA